jgi:hypothetical protein
MSEQLGRRRGPVSKNDKQFRAAVLFVVTIVRLGGYSGMVFWLHILNKEFWEELTRLLSLHTSLHVMAATLTLAKDCMWCNQNNPTIKQSQTIAVQGWKSCPQITTLNLNHLKMVEAMGLKIIASRSTWIAVAPCQITWKSTKRFKS